MNNINATGRSSLASTLSSIEPAGPLTLPRFLFLVFLGALTVLLHQTFHYPLKMPGHHGLEAMAILAFGRLVCTHRWAATIVALSTATTGVAFGTSLHDGWPAPVLDVVPGVFTDLLVLAYPAWRGKLAALPAMVAVAYAMKPVLRFVGAELAGLHFGSLRSGLLFPLATHLMYAFTGALIAVVLWRGWASRHTPQR